MIHPKPKTYRNPKYLDFIRKKPCLVCAGESIAHHESGTKLSHGAMGRKSNDLTAVPLCFECHQKRHDQGYITFWNSWAGIIMSDTRLLADGIVMREIIKLQMEWIEK